MGDNELINYVREDLKRMDANINANFDKLRDEIQQLRKDQGADCSTKRSEIYTKINKVDERLGKVEAAIVKLNMGLTVSGFIAGSAVTALVGIIIKKAFGG